LAITKEKLPLPDHSACGEVIARARERGSLKQWLPVIYQHLQAFVCPDTPAKLLKLLWHHRK